ncbi:MAG: hypothetical protein AAF725_26505, partial [Acidobacteriota bacterium]
MSFPPPPSSLAAVALLATAVTGVAWLAARTTSSAARRNSILLPTLWLLLAAPLAPWLVKAWGLAFEIEAPFAPPAAESPAARGQLSGDPGGAAPPVLSTAAPRIESGGAPAAQAAPPREKLPPIPWAQIALWLWLLGTVASLLGMARSWRRLRRLVRHTRPVPEALGPSIEGARRLAGPRGGRRRGARPQVVISDAITTPVAVGWGRGARTLLPAAFT